MTSSKSLFNPGVYQNTIKRFKWGGLLYFIILFFSLPFVILVQEKEYLLMSHRWVPETTPLILNSGFIVIPILLAMIVPTIVATLCFNNVHSAKQGNFVHTLPFTRLENYISTLLAGLTLITIPVLLNAIILLIMSLTGYQEVITSSSVVYWFFINITISFIMLSVSVFSAYLTGHTAAHIAINILVHTFPLIIALGIFLISEIFLYGFSESDNFIANEIASNTPIVWLYGKTLYFQSEGNLFLQKEMWIFIVIAIIFYYLAYLLYKNRKIEACGDVAAFKIFRPILKYTATVFAAVLAFGILTASSMGAVPIFIFAIAVTAVVYFASEMLIRKTVKVFDSYKGYIGFAVFMAIFISIFAYTDIFGYERRIPHKEDVESATIYYRYGDNIPMIADEKLIEDVRAMHGELIRDIPVVNDIFNTYTTLYVKYDLKNGKVLERQYEVTDEVRDYILSKMYETTEYKNIMYSFDIINIDNVKNMDLRVNSSSFNYHIAVNDNSKAILQAIKKDLESLTYDEIETQEFAINLSFYIQQTAEDNKLSNVFVETYTENEYYTNRMYSFSMRINSNFKNTFALLKELGYYDEVIDAYAKGVKLCTIPVYVKNGEYTYKNDTGKPYEFNVSTKDLVPIDTQHSYELAEKLISVPTGTGYGKASRLPDGKYYLVYSFTDNLQTIELDSHTAAFSEEILPEYLKQFITE